MNISLTISVTILAFIGLLAAEDSPFDKLESNAGKFVRIELDDGRKLVGRWDAEKKSFMLSIKGSDVGISLIKYSILKVTTEIEDPSIKPETAKELTGVELSAKQIKSLRAQIQSLETDIATDKAIVHNGVSTYSGVPGTRRNDEFKVQKARERLAANEVLLKAKKNDLFESESASLLANAQTASATSATGRIISNPDLAGFRAQAIRITQIVETNEKNRRELTELIEKIRTDFAAKFDRKQLPIPQITDANNPRQLAEMNAVIQYNVWVSNTSAQSIIMGNFYPAELKKYLEQHNQNDLLPYLTGGPAAQWDARNLENTR